VRSDPPHHDELLFVVQHQTTELWLKLVLHELRGAAQALAADDLRPALKRLARVKHVQRTLTEQWSVLATLTPSGVRRVPRRARDGLGLPVRGLPRGGVRPRQQERRHAAGLRARAGVARLLAELLEAPSVYDEFLRYLARAGHDVPAACSSAT
jgi:tryptophan 2,3-dioxygenase